MEDNWKSTLDQYYLEDHDAGHQGIVAFLRTLKINGIAQAQVRDYLEDRRKNSRLTEVQEDRILEILDFVVGWTHSDNQIW